MKVKVVEGFQVVDKDGKAQTSGTVEMDDAEARQAIAAGWVEKASSSSKKAPAARNKKQPESSNK
jgi:predicted regulator of Ras-like GTPase activity (Roadblock/LC7/MglB family)